MVAVTSDTVFDGRVVKFIIIDGANNLTLLMMALKILVKNNFKKTKLSEKK